MMAARRLAITLGDPRGIGPEVARAALLALAGEAGLPEFLLVGPEGVLPDSRFPLYETGTWRAGGDAVAAGQHAGRAVETAVQLVRDGEVQGLVTAPLDKSALHAAGYDYPGHTEMLAALAGGVDVAMMMSAETTSLGGPLRVVLATTHHALRDVPRLFDENVLVTQTQITYLALQQQWAIARPRIALCAFNPHASDQGLFGDEEARIYVPAMQRLNTLDMPALGPLPADTVFTRALRGEFDAVIAPYHDVGMAAFKTASFGQGVNVTLGLPFVRTSPDHGTAFDIAGRGVADASSMIAAIRLAARLVERTEATR